MPGPWVVDRVIDLMYVPFAVAGFSFHRVSMRAWTLAASCSGGNDALPIADWMMPAFSTRNSTRPALSSLTALVTSAVTVPTLGFGIRPRGPRMRPILPTDAIMSGVATSVSKSNQFSSLILVMYSSPPAKSAPASSASLTLSPLAMTTTRFDLPVPDGITHEPRTSWSAYFGLTPRRTAMSTVSSHLAETLARGISAQASSIV